MTQQHTKEPWYYEPSDEFKRAVDIKSGEWFVATAHDGCESQHNAEANARRIVACVNACAGISTWRLEELGAGGLSRAFQNAEDAADSIGAQRDELAEALRVAAGQVALLGGTPDPNNPNADQVQIAVQEAIRAALSRLDQGT